MKSNDVNMKLARLKPRNMMALLNFIYFKLIMVEFLMNTKNPKTENSNWNHVWLMILSIDWGLMIVIGAENKWPRVFSKWIKESWDWVSCSYLLKLESNSGFQCFQLCSNDCLSFIGLCGRCMSGLHFMSLLELIWPSRPAYNSK